MEFEDLNLAFNGKYVMEGIERELLIYFFLKI